MGEAKITVGIEKENSNIDTEISDIKVIEKPSSRCGILQFTIIIIVLVTLTATTQLISMKQNWWNNAGKLKDIS